MTSAMSRRRRGLDEAGIRLQIRIVLVTAHSAIKGVRALPIPIQDRRDRLNEIRRRAHAILDATSEEAELSHPGMLWEIEDARAQVNTTQDS